MHSRSPRYILRSHGSNFDRVIPNPTTPQQLGAEPDLNFIVTTPPSLPSASSRTSSRAGNKSKVVKKSSSRKKAETSLASPPRKRGSRETSTLIDDNTDTRSYSTSTMTSSPGIQDSEYGFQQQDQRSFQAPPMQYLPPMMHDDYLQYQGMGNIGPQTGMGYDFPPQQQQYQGPSPDYSSRIEDVRRAPSEQDQEGEGTEVRSQYIVASPDSIWRAAPQ
ncbi:uncharacterized protein LY89DRAFT_713711, partial [Mollisia scopiformis]